MTFMITQHLGLKTICSPKLIAIFSHLEKFKGLVRSQGYEILSFQWTRETVQIEVIIVRPNFHVNISEQFTICECMRSSFERLVNMDLEVDVNEDDYLRKEVSCSETNLTYRAGQSNNSKIILKWLRYYIFCNYLQHKKLKPSPHL